MRPQPSTSTGDQLARLDQLGDPGAGVGQAEPEVVAQVALGGDAQRAGGDPDQLALGVLGGRGVGAAMTVGGSTRSGRS